METTFSTSSSRFRYWHTTNTVGDYLRVCSCLTRARDHGIRAIDTNHTALTETPGSRSRHHHPTAPSAVTGEPSGVTSEWTRLEVRRCAAG